MVTIKDGVCVMVQVVTAAHPSLEGAAGRLGLCWTIPMGGLEPSWAGQRAQPCWHRNIPTLGAVVGSGQGHSHPCQPPPAPLPATCWPWGLLLSATEPFSTCQKCIRKISGAAGRFLVEEKIKKKKKKVSRGHLQPRKRS